MCSFQEWLIPLPHPPPFFARIKQCCSFYNQPWDKLTNCISLVPTLLKKYSKQVCLPSQDYPHKDNSIIFRREGLSNVEDVYSLAAVYKLEI